MSEIQLPEAFLKLGEVLEQGQFELLFTEEKLRLVYLMNDAVESFLVFENARMTGQYREDYEGELEAATVMVLSSSAANTTDVPTVPSTNTPNDNTLTKIPAKIFFFIFVFYSSISFHLFYFLVADDNG